MIRNSVLLKRHAACFNCLTERSLRSCIDRSINKEAEGAAAPARIVARVVLHRRRLAPELLVVQLRPTAPQKI
eukprot:6201906-Pleurochrysis_carterae.AAC.1